MNNSNDLNDYTLEDLKEILRNACFHPDRIPGQINLRAEMCEKYALQALWFVREIRFKNFVCSQQSVRELLLREMTVSELDMAEHQVKASRESDGTGSSRKFCFSISCSETIYGDLIMQKKLRRMTL